MKIRALGHYLTIDSFFSQARSLRSHFDKNFSNPKSAHNARFTWDYWHVPGQYTLLRTPAYYYFKQSLYKKFHEALLKFGREHLGCYDVTPPWLSYYVEGCRQELHADVPHGPWAYVYSLTEWDIRKFTGGETFLLKPKTLNYWQNFETYKGVESKDLTETIEPRFNRLTVFDPRLPHGVREVRGTQDPREARLVIHGWFMNPEPYVRGSMTRKQGAVAANEILDKLSPLFESYSDCHGTISARLKITAKGKVTSAKYMTNTLQSLVNDEARVYQLNRSIIDTIKKSKLPSARGESEMTLPILFHF